MSNLNNELEYDNFSDWLQFCVEQILKSLFVCLPGTVISYNSQTRRAKIKLALNQVKTDGSTFEYPNLVDVPVIFPSGGGFSLLMPLKQDDSLLVLFSQRDISQFKESYSLSIPETHNFFRLKDAIAIAGFGALTTTIPLPNSLTLQSNDGQSFIAISDDTITIQANNVIINSNVEIVGGVTWSGVATGDSGPAQFSGGIVNTGGQFVSNGITYEVHVHPSPAGGNTGTPL